MDLNPLRARRHLDVILTYPFFSSGVSTSLRCSVEANPRPNFKWLVQGHVMKEDSDQSESEAATEEKKTHTSVYDFEPNRDQQGAEIKCLVNGNTEVLGLGELSAGHNALRPY